jgi:hypothetical protein
MRQHALLLALMGHGICHSWLVLLPLLLLLVVLPLLLLLVVHLALSPLLSRP